MFEELNTRRGKLTIVRYVGRTDTRGERIYECMCSCGVFVQRTQSQLCIRKISACEACREAYADKALALKSREKNKKTKHAYYQSARQAASLAYTKQNQVTRPPGVSAETWYRDEDHGHQPEETQQRKPLCVQSQAHQRDACDSVRSGRTQHAR